MYGSIFHARFNSSLSNADTIPMDAEGFHLRVIDLRNPDYSH